MNCIEVKQLNKTFDYHTKETGIKNSLKNLFVREKLYKTAVNDISFSIEEGEFVGFIGPNGSGKTTTLKMLSGILFPTSGEATVLGYTPWERKKDFKRQISIIMGQKNQLWWDLPANESLYLNKCIYEVEDKAYQETMNYLAELLDVKHILNIQVRRLSLGERMKLELIAALIHKPRIVLLDEPTIGLDLIAQRKIREFLGTYNKQNKTTIILTSHYLKDIEELCDRTIVINQGNIMYDGSLKEVSEVINGSKLIKLRFREKVAKEAFTTGKIRQYDGESIVLEVEKDIFEITLKNILGQFPISDFTVEDVPLEEGIEKMYKLG